MDITVTCPECRTRYQLKEEMRGKTIQCPNKPRCRAVFTIIPDAAAPAAPPPPSPSEATPPSNGPSQSGTVGDLIPILPAEPTLPFAEPVEPAAEDSSVRRSKSGTVGDLVPLLEGNPTVQTDWSQPPPVRQKPATPPATPRTTRAGDTVQRPAAPATTRITAPPKPEATPPPRKPAHSSAAAAPTILVPPPAKDPEPPPAAEGPRVLGPGDWQAPPPRRLDSSGQRTPPQGTPKLEEPPVLEVIHETPAEEHSEPSPQAKRGKMLVWVSLGVLAVLTLGGGGLAYMLFRDIEGRLFARAMKDYQDHLLNPAAEKFEHLQKQFGDSKSEYEVLKDLCRLRLLLEDLDKPTTDCLEKCKAFLLKHSRSPALNKDYHADLGKSLMIRVGKLADTVDPRDPKTPELIDGVREVVDDVNVLPGALTRENLTQADEVFAQIRHKIENEKRRQVYLVQLQRLVPRPSGASLREARRLIKDAEEIGGVPGFSSDSEAVGLVRQIQEGHRAAVKYQEEQTRLKVPEVHEDALPTLLVDARVKGPTERLDAPLVLSQARGVLYAHNQKTGRVHWATRVGIDSTTLPVRLPATPINPERILVFSADSNTLTAFDSNKRIVWQYPLGTPCLGRPLIVDQQKKAYIPTFDGQIHEIELINGTLLGKFQLGEGERLTVGGAHQHLEGTDLLFFPADEGCVYVLDVSPRKPKQCVAILYTDHPSGSLRGEPLIIPPDPPSPGYLVLTQTDGLDKMQLRVYNLPILASGAEPIALTPKPQVRGWGWFPPYSDAEKIALLTDQGMMGLFGIRQMRNKDQAIFALYPAGPEGLRLASPPGGGPAADKIGRSQVVHMQGDDYWVLVDGQMKRLQMAWKAGMGPQLIPIWDKLMLGSPLHVSQVVEDPNTGRNTLYVTTHAPDRPACLMTAVDDEDGAILWQRQLGLVCQGEVVSLKPPDGKGLPLTVAMDPGGAMLYFDPTPCQDMQRGQWRSGGERLADAFAENPRFAPALLVDDQGQNAWQVGCPGVLGAATPANAGKTLLIRRMEWRPGKRELEVVSAPQVPLEAGPAGSPVRQGDKIVLALNNGQLVRISLREKEPKAIEGPTWRARRLGPETPGYVLALDDEKLLTCNGLDGITCWRWGKGAGDFGPLASQNAPAKRADAIPISLRLESRLIAPPLLVPPGDPQGKPRVSLAEANGTVRLVKVQDEGRLTTERRWDVKGRVTAGPFLRLLPSGEKRIGCVVDRTRLVWLDPDRPDPDAELSAPPLWEYAEAEAIVGQPQLIKGMLVVADQAGRFVGLDPATGKVRKPDPAALAASAVGQAGGLPSLWQTGLTIAARMEARYTLQGNMSATVSPVPFGPRKAFAPLTDGTVLLLPVP